MIWKKAQELYQMEQAKTMGADFKGITAERKELCEGGYFYTAKLIVLLTIPLRKLGSEKTVQTIRRMSICVTYAIEMA